MAELTTTRIFGTLTVDDEANIDGLLKPGTDEAHDIGDAYFRWRDLLLSRDILMGGSVKDSAGANATTPANLKTAYDHSQAVTGAEHGAVSAATANMIARRDSGGRSKFAAPAANGDALIKGTAITDVEHGVRTLANAHAHGHLSGIGINDHHDRDHATTHGSGQTDAVTLDASQIGTGRLNISRLPDDTDGHVLTAKGAGTDPEYAEKSGDFSSQSLTIETRTDDPISPADGRIWLRTDL